MVLNLRVASLFTAVVAFDFQDQVRPAVPAGGFSTSIHNEPLASQPLASSGGMNVRGELDIRRQLLAESGSTSQPYMFGSVTSERGGPDAPNPDSGVEHAITHGFHAAAARLLAEADASQLEVFEVPLMDWFVSTWNPHNLALTDEEWVLISTLFAEFKRRNGFAGAADDVLVSRDFTRAWSVRHWFLETAPQLAEARKTGLAREAEEQEAKLKQEL